MKHPFEVLVLALLFSGNILAYQGQRKKALEDISRNGLQGITTLGKGEILSEDLRAAIPLHPLVPDKFRKGPFTLPSQEELWNDMKARSGDQFIPYEKLRQSRRYQLLSRLDQLEMVSVQHNRSSVDRTLTAVLMSQCNGPSPDALQSNPICSCGFHLGEEATIQPIREIEKSIDLGIRETVEALKASTYQEKILPYLVGLEEVGEKDKASAIRRVLALSPSAGETFLSQLEEVLNPLAIQGINEAFRGRVVVVRRDLDQLYGVLIHRKYSLAQVRKIFLQWLKEEEISEGTFVQFIGQGEPGREAPQAEDDRRSSFPLSEERKFCGRRG